MNALQKKLISAALAASVLLITSFLAVVFEMPVEAGFADINFKSWVVIIGGGLLAFAKDIGAYMATPPSD